MKGFEVSRAVQLAEETIRDLGNAIQPSKTYLDLPKGDLRMMPAYLPNLNIFGVKLVTVFPENKKLPTVMSQTILFDPETGEMIGSIASTHLTALRTGAVGAVAAKYLCDKENVTVSIFGLGVQGFMQIRCLQQVKSIERIFAFDRDPDRLEEFKETFSNVEINEQPNTACLLSDIIITTTPSRKAIICDSWIKNNGVLILAIGADAPGKRELAFQTLTRCNSLIVCDSVEQAMHSGEINVGLNFNELTRAAIKQRIFGDLTKVIDTGLPNKEEKTIIFDSTGIAALDISFAKYAIDQKLWNRVEETRSA